MLPPFLGVPHRGLYVPGPRWTPIPGVVAPTSTRTKIVISGQAIDNNGNPLVGATVSLFVAALNGQAAYWYADTTSDGSGNYSFTVGLGPQYWVRAVSSDGTLVGTTVSTLQGS